MTTPKRPEKAYKNLDFLTSHDGRLVRILSEFLEPQSRLRRHRVRDTIVFFGSARTLPPETARERLADAEAALAAVSTPLPDLLDAKRRAERDLAQSRYYAEATELSRRLSAWSQGLPQDGARFVVCSGGGPGIMEAANRGASEAGAKTLALNISLPMEQHGNPYQTPELAFEFHYFFVRKFWFMYLAKALVVFPGGFGTLDELFEVLTLVQTHKVVKPVPVVMYGGDFWRRLIDFDLLVEWGMIAPEDLHLFRICDNVDDAFDYLTAELNRHYLHPVPNHENHFPGL